MKDITLVNNIGTFVVKRGYHPTSIGDLYRLLLFVLDPLVFLLQLSFLNYLAFQSFDFERAQ
jgi:hypothetical protein